MHVKLENVLQTVSMYLYFVALDQRTKVAWGTFKYDDESASFSKCGHHFEIFK